MSLNFHKCKFGVFVSSYGALKRSKLEYLGKSVDCNEIDHWRDIAGYALLVVRELESEDECDRI